MTHPDPSSPLPSIAITTGDPGGIGPEVIVKALADPALRDRAHIHIYGPAAALEHAARAAGIKPFWTARAENRAEQPATATLIDYPAQTPFTAGPDKAQGDLSFRLVEDAIAAARRRADDPLHAHAIVTGPISKHAWSLAGHAQYPGHTELLAVRLGAKRHAMMFVSPRLRVILATAHIPLMSVGRTLTTARILEVIELGNDACRQLGIPRPRIAVCGLNPHAGESGMLGDEDQRIIDPAIRRAVEAQIDAGGPFPADTIYNAALRGDFDLVVAMYHDQGLIPVKLLAWDVAVNLTVGLPIIRTSPDHGTAFNIAGKNQANPGSMRAAIELAITMASGATRPDRAVGGH